MPKLKTHKGLAKRIKITAKGKVKFRKVGSGHLNSHMSGNEIRAMRGGDYVKKGDIKRLERMLHRPLLSADK